MSRILIIDDDKTFCRMLSLKVELLGHEPRTAHSLAEGLALAQEGTCDLVYLDVRLPDGDGLAFLPRIRETPSHPQVIIMTGAGDANGAELAIKTGAWDYIRKPASLEDLTLALNRALQYREEKAAHPLLALRREGIVGDGPALAACLDLLAQAAASRVNVLLTGETGTGKELFARAIHDNSSRAGGPFVVVDCSALPETLVESILFGHEKGAFTGAHRTGRGLVAQAHGGTLFLDEVGELTPSTQRTFLRVLQDRRFRPLGSGREVESDFRLVAATNRDLEALTAGGGFRQDLLYRLSGLSIHLPPLRERREDIPALAAHHVERLGRIFASGTKGFSPEFLSALTAYDWPGNVRELVGTLERALAGAGPAPTLFPRHLPQKMRIALAKASLEEEGGVSIQAAEGRENAFPTLKEFRRSMDRQYLEDLLYLSGDDMARAARLSGLSRSRLYGLMKELGLERGK